MSTVKPPLDLFIRPADVLLFRDGRPFSAGDDHRAAGTFPPAPVALYGALRSAAFAHQGAGFRRGRLDLPPGASPGVARELGTPAEPGEMAITHFGLAHAPAGQATLTPLFPMPADVLRTKDRSRRFASARGWMRVVPTAFTGPVQPKTNLTPGSIELLWQRRDERAWYEPAAAFVTLPGFAAYLATGAVPEPFVHPEAARRPGEDDPALGRPYDGDPRAALRIDPGRQIAADGVLFTVDYTAANRDVGFAVRLENATSLGPPPQWLRLGGEARAARYEPCAVPGVPDAQREAIRDAIRKAGRFKLVVTTAAPFSRGWLPDGIGADGTGTLAGVEGCTVRLAGAALGRHQTLGGWDIVRNRPRPARRAVPPGSVYFFEVVSGDAGALFDALFSRSACRDENDRKLGLGLAYLGTY